MDIHAALAAFPFGRPLYAHAPVLRVRDARGDWVPERTGLVHSGGAAIGAWLTALRRREVEVVAPAVHLVPNPRRLADGAEWVFYPLVAGGGYRAGLDRIADAGRLLGRMHAAGVPEARGLPTHERPIIRTRGSNRI